MHLAASLEAAQQQSQVRHGGRDVLVVALCSSVHVLTLPSSAQTVRTRVTRMLVNPCLARTLVLQRPATCCAVRALLQDYVRELQTITEERNVVTEELIATEAKLTASQVQLGWQGHGRGGGVSCTHSLHSFGFGSVAVSAPARRGGLFATSCCCCRRRRAALRLWPDIA